MTFPQNIEAHNDVGIAAKDDPPATDSVASSLRRHVVAGTTGTFGLRALSSVGQFAIGVMLARLLGASGYGIYSYAMALVALLLVPVQLGLPQFVVRQVAQYREREEWATLRGLLQYANVSVGLLAVLTGVVAWFVSWQLGQRAGDDPAWLAPFWFALLLLPIMSLSALREATLRGLRYVVLGQAPEAVVWPGVTAVGIGGILLSFGPSAVTPLSMVGVRVLAAVAAFCTGFYWLLRRMPDAMRSVEPEFRARSWIGDALPFTVLAGLNVVNQRMDIVMLGAFQSEEVVGVYSVVMTAGILTLFGYQSVNVAVGPQVARLWARQDIAGIQDVARMSARLGVSIGSFVFLTYALFGSPLLSGVFGPEFAAGSLPLTIYAFGQLLLVLSGSAGQILTMTAHASAVTLGVAAAAVLNVVLNLLLVPSFGAEGAAAATAVSAGFMGLFFYIETRRRVGVSSSPFGSSSRGLR